MAMKIREFDPARYLRTDEERAGYLSEALTTGNKAFIADALGVVARAKGMSKLAKQTKLSREGLYRTLSAAGNPELDTLLKVFGALDLQLSVKPAERPKRARRRKAA
jgi:probable addiction module antidote protein